MLPVVTVGEGMQKAALLVDAGGGGECEEKHGKMKRNLEEMQTNVPISIFIYLHAFAWVRRRKRT